MKRTIAWLLAAILLLSLVPFASASREMTGDLNGDSSVDMRDLLMLRRWFAGGYGVVLDEEDADLDHDGSATVRDLVLLRQYLAHGYGVTLEPWTPKKFHLTMTLTTDNPAYAAQSVTGTYTSELRQNAMLDGAMTIVNDKMDEVTEKFRSTGLHARLDSMLDAYTASVLAGAGTDEWKDFVSSTTESTASIVSLKDELYDDVTLAYKDIGAGEWSITFAADGFNYTAALAIEYVAV